MNAISHAQQVLQALATDPPVLEKCLRALADLQNGQILLQKEESRTALSHLSRAAKIFESIPVARFLLGIACADIAAANANLEQWSQAASYAHRAIEIAANDRAFAETEANARMTLANSLGSLGDLRAAKQEYSNAENIYKTLPDVQLQLAMLKHNRRFLLGPWWKRLF
jgi:tetratricopeptide (TPR) repeat protein